MTFKNIKEFFSKDIWYVRLDKFPRWQRGGIKLARIVLMSVRDFSTKQLELRATSLTLYSLLSIVPVIAMIFGIAHGFGLEAYLTDQLEQAFAGQPVILENLIDYVHNILTSTKGEVIAGFGFILLLWSVIQVLSSIEDTFNSIWYVKTSRTWARKFTDYLSIMMLAPVFIALTGVVNVFIATQIQSFARQLLLFGPVVSKAVVFFINLLPYFTTAVLFFMLYIVMPNTRVKPKAAWYASIVAGVVFQLFQWAYIEFQVGVSRYNAIYGSFASIPLFITWLQFSWMIVLIGAEIAYSVQNVTNFDMDDEKQLLSHKMRMLYSIYILRYVCLKFSQAKPAPDIAEMSSKLDIKAGLLKNLLDDMQESHLVATTAVEGTLCYLPASDISTYTVAFVIHKLESEGSLRKVHAGDDTFFRIKSVYSELERSMLNAPSNKNILEV
ncbi:MAG: YihY/virulence factor BrkB family protein [Bacteroidota bacterium]|jgi:membrane protein